MKGFQVLYDFLNLYKVGDGSCIKRKIFEARKYLIFINSYNWKANGFTLPVFEMMVYVSGINERFNSAIVKTHNKYRCIYQSTYSIKDSVHTTFSSI